MPIARMETFLWRHFRHLKKRNILEQRLMSIIVWLLAFALSVKYLWKGYLAHERIIGFSRSNSSNFSPHLPFYHRCHHHHHHMTWPRFSHFGVSKMAHRVPESKFRHHFSIQSSPQNPQKAASGTQVGPRKVTFWPFCTFLDALASQAFKLSVSQWVSKCFFSSDL